MEGKLKIQESEVKSIIKDWLKTKFASFDSAGGNLQVEEIRGSGYASFDLEVTFNDQPVKEEVAA